MEWGGILGVVYMRMYLGGGMRRCYLNELKAFVCLAPGQFLLHLRLQLTQKVIFRELCHVVLNLLLCARLQRRSCDALQWIGF